MYSCLYICSYICKRATNNILNSYDVRQVDYSKGILFNQDMVNEDLEDTLNEHYKSNNNILDFVNTENKQYNFFKLKFSLLFISFSNGPEMKNGNSEKLLIRNLFSENYFLFKGNQK